METAPVRAKKGKGLDDLLGTITPQDVDEFQSIPVARNSFFLLLEKFGEFMNQEDPTDYCRKQVQEILTPSEINSFLQATILYEHVPARFGGDVYRNYTGIFISQLLQNSCRAGYDDFALDTAVVGKIDHLGMGVKNLRLTVRGDVGIHFCTDAENVDVALYGSAENYCAQDMKRSRFTAHGEIYRHNKYTLGGRSAESWLSCGLDAENTVFHTSNRNTLTTLLVNYEPAAGNKIKVMQPDGQYAFQDRIFNLGLSGFLTFADTVSRLREGVDEVRGWYSRFLEGGRK